jgi:hypothetical protein
VKQDPNYLLGEDADGDPPESLVNRHFESFDALMSALDGGSKFSNMLCGLIAQKLEGGS